MKNIEKFYVNSDMCGSECVDFNKFKNSLFCIYDLENESVSYINYNSYVIHTNKNGTWDHSIITEPDEYYNYVIKMFERVEDMLINVFINEDIVDSLFNNPLTVMNGDDKYSVYILLELLTGFHAVDAICNYTKQQLSFVNKQMSID